MLTYDSKCAASLLMPISNEALEIRQINLFSGGTFMIPSTVRNRFYEVLSHTEDNISAFVNNPGSDMTRHRYCDFKNTVLATLSFSMSRSNTELLNYFGFNCKHIPSKSAFTQQKKKFNNNLFPHLLASFNKATPFTKTFKGFHLVAADGSDINLPTDKRDTVYRIKQARSDNFYFQMHLNALFDICENRFISAVTQPRPQMNENAAFCKLVAECNMPPNTIFIADRGYMSLNTLAHLLEEKRYFLIRAKSPTSSGSITKNILEPDVPSDKYIKVGVSRFSKNRHTGDFDVFKLIAPKRKFDYISTDNRQSTYTMNLRFTCIEIGDGSYEYLVSNLPTETFSSEDLKDLYWKRWSIETSFRSLKYALSLVYLHSVNRDLIIQEVYAKILLYNITSLIHSYAQDSRELLERNKNKKHEYKVSFDDAVPIAKELIKGPVKNSTIKALLLRHLTAISTIVKSPRQMRSQTVKPLGNRA